MIQLENSGHVFFGQPGRSQKGIGSFGLIGQPTVPPSSFAREHETIAEHLVLPLLTSNVSFVAGGTSQLGKTAFAIKQKTTRINRVPFPSFNRINFHNGMSLEDFVTFFLTTLGLVFGTTRVNRPNSVLEAQGFGGLFGMKVLTMFTNGSVPSVGGKVR